MAVEELHRRLDRYFVTMRTMLDTERRGEILKALELARETIRSLPLLVDQFASAHGQLDIQFPAILLGARYWPVLGDQQAADEMISQIAKRAALAEKCGQVIKQMNTDFLSSAGIATYLRAHPNTLQKSLGKATGVAGPDCARIVKTMDKLGLLQRSQHEGSYRLALA
jgi:hypothetical protein